MVIKMQTLIKPLKDRNRNRCNRWKGRYLYIMIGKNRPFKKIRESSGLVNLAQTRQNMYQKIPPMFWR